MAEISDLQLDYQFTFTEPGKAAKNSFEVRASAECYS
jgi:hypothetical protein